ncbi:unnamed protein product [Rotaria sp. Silwood1]|nr:unnamed protein product [Rotaria sp. Silwood1]
MNLRKHNYPPGYWLNLHRHIQHLLPSSLPKKSRPPTQKRLEACLLYLYPYIQKMIYCASIDRKKGHIRSGKIPISPEQFALIQKLGGTLQYGQIAVLEQILQLQYDFEYKGYHRGVQNIQFRIQKQKSVIVGKSPLLLLRLRFQQKQPVLIG